MGKRAIHREEKIVTGINFLLFAPVRFNISAPRTFQDRFKEFCEDKKINKSKMLRGLLFDFFKVKNEYELIRQNRLIKKSLLDFGTSITDEMGVDKREFSRWGREAIENKIKESKWKPKEKFIY